MVLVASCKIQNTFFKRSFQFSSVLKISLQSKRMSLKSLLKIAEQYIRRHPTPSSIQVLKGLLKLNYTYNTPITNSKSKKEILYPIANLQPFTTIQSINHTLAFDQKTNRLQYANNYDSILTDEAHDKILQDPIFGTAKLNINKDKWIYAAKKKVSKTKGYFSGGFGKNVYQHDLGQLYDDVTDVGIYIWDLKLKKIISIDIKVQGDESKYVYAYPIFTNSEGTKFMCHGYRKTQFGHGVSYCFNRPIQIFEVSIDNIGQENMKINSVKLIKKHETNIFANISPCFNYILYFGGCDYVHSYELDLVILKRRINKYEELTQKGYHNEWEQIHRIKEGFVGNYITNRTETFVFDGQPYAYFQTTEQAKQVIKCINMQSGDITQVSKNNIGQSFSITNFCRQQQLVLGSVTNHNFNTFFYCKTGQNIPKIIPPLNKQQFILEQLKQPIHGFYLQSGSIEQQFKKQKKPLVVIVHGGPHSSADSCLTLFKYMLLKCGYAILLPNYSGSTSFGAKYTKGALGNIGKTDADQIISQLQIILEKKPHLDKDKVFVYGGSYGGYMAAIMGSRYSTYFKAAVILNGVLSVPGNFWFSDIPQWSTAQSLRQAKIHGLTGDDYLKMFEQSPISSPMKIPTLQFLGAKDRRVPYRQGLLFDGMTKKVGVPIQTYVYENAAHSLADSVQTSIDVIIKSILFLEGLPLKEQKSEQKKQQKKEEKTQDNKQQKREQKTE